MKNHVTAQAIDWLGSAGLLVLHVRLDFDWQRLLCWAPGVHSCVGLTLTCCLQGAPSWCHGAVHAAPCILMLWDGMLAVVSTVSV